MVTETKSSINKHFLVKLHGALHNVNCSFIAAYEYVYTVLVQVRMYVVINNCYMHACDACNNFAYIMILFIS